MSTTIHYAVIALRLAREPGGVTPTRLADECGIHRTSAHSVLRSLWQLGEIERSGDRGRRGHTYRIGGRR